MQEQESLFHTGPNVITWENVDSVELWIDVVITIANMIMMVAPLTNRRVLAKKPQHCHIVKKGILILLWVLWGYYIIEFILTKYSIKNNLIFFIIEIK